MTIPASSSRVSSHAHLERLHDVGEVLEHDERGWMYHEVCDRLDKLAVEQRFLTRLRDVLAPDPPTYTEQEWEAMDA